MCASTNQNRLFCVINLLLIGLGSVYLLLQLESIGAFTIVDAAHRTMLAAPFTVLWGLTIIVWLVMVIQRFRHTRTRGRKRALKKLLSEEPARTTVRPTFIHDVWANSRITTRATRQQNSDINSVLGAPHTSGHTLQQNSILALKATNQAAAVAFALDHVTKPISWSDTLLAQLEWHHFEQVCICFFDQIGFTAVSSFEGPEAEISLHIRQTDGTNTAGLVKTKAGQSIVGIEQVRAFYAAMKQERVAQGFFITSGQFTDEAKRAARGVGMFLIDGSTMLEKIYAMTPSQQEKLLAIASKDRYRVPACPLCLKKMALQENEFTAFWRCTDHRNCRGQLRPERAKSAALPTDM